MSQISVLIITFNREQDTLALLENLHNQIHKEKCIGEILLLNNHSDQSYQKVEDFISQNPEDKIHYIYHQENLGVARGRNYLIKLAKFPVLLVLDDDVLFKDNDAIHKASQLFEQPQYIKNNVAIITLNVFYYVNKQRQKNALPHKKYDQYKDKPWFLTNYFVGAAHLMKKELFEETGYYPTDFFYGMEEYDLSYRVVEAGYALAFDSTIIVYHKESPQGRIPNDEKLYSMWRNKSIVAKKYLPNRFAQSTYFIWGLHYLVKSGYNWRNYFKYCKQIKNDLKTVKLQKIGMSALTYLKQVEARLNY